MSDIDIPPGTLMRTLTGHTRCVYTVIQLRDDDRVVSASDDNTLRIWDLATGTCVSTLTGHTNWVTIVIQLRDDDRLVSGSGDNTLRIWDLSTGTCVSTLTGHTNGVSTVIQLRDDDRLVSGSGDRTLRIWSMRTIADQRWMRRRMLVLLVASSSILHEPLEDALVRQQQNPLLRLDALRRHQLELLLRSSLSLHLSTAEVADRAFELLIHRVLWIPYVFKRVKSFL